MSQKCQLKQYVYEGLNLFEKNTKEYVFEKRNLHSSFTFKNRRCFVKYVEKK